jgi:two-component system chemotaxis response regulator CheB
METPDPTASLPADRDVPPVVVVGASLGGVAALQRLAAALPEGFPAAVLVVQHTAPDGPGLLGGILDAAGPLPAALATDGERLQPGTIRVAPPDRHLVVRGGTLRLTREARENHSRPSLDPLFRSAAISHGSRVIGVVLTGLLNDGAAGLLAVQRCGGRTVVQAPGDAAHAGMPLSALAALTPDHTVPLDDIGPLLQHLVHMPTPPSPPPPDDLVREDRSVNPGVTSIAEVEAWGERAPVTCPECGGTLWSRTDGHAYTAQALVAEQDEVIEQALWSALRILVERATALDALAHNERARGRASLAERYEARAAESNEQAQRLRDAFQALAR